VVVGEWEEARAGDESAAEEGGERLSIICRWMDTILALSLSYPYENVKLECGLVAARRRAAPAASGRGLQVRVFLSPPVKDVYHSHCTTNAGLISYVSFIDYLEGDATKRYV